MLLQDRLKQSRTMLDEVFSQYGPDRTAVAWTGGKDSTVALWLWRGLLQEHGKFPLRAVNLDTGLKFPQILELRNRMALEWDIALHVQKPNIDLSGYPVAADKLSCCRDLKILPLQQAIQECSILALITGLRRDEHPNRTDRDYLEQRRNPDHVQVNPILDWTEMDVWACIMEHDLPYCSLYNVGYRSLGCMPCTLAPDQVQGSSERAGRDPQKERQMETLRSLGYF
ncbi:phosphoadenosine phosphosulfate reductase family protein [Desulfonatronum parangueonense]